MLEQRFMWKNKHIREQAAIIDGKQSPTLLLKNARFLHSVLRQWVNGNIWIHHNRIVYAGEALPKKTNGTEIVDCSGLTLVPGYIEPHSHPYLLYNPQSLSRYAAQTGTTTLINDNLFLFLHLQKKKAFSLLAKLWECPVTMYWWARYDAQTVLNGEEMIFSNRDVKEWIEHDKVIQGGELTGWPQLLDGDDLMLYWIQETKRIGKKVEGHFPGASDRTLAKMMLFGTDSDHESITGEDIYKRLMHGYTVSLRHSSVRPDLPVLLKEMKEQGIGQYDSMVLTTDGSTPSFYKQGMSDMMVRIAIESGVPAIDAYHMASYNVAKHYNLQHLHGMIATGRVASINFLENEQQPTPISVLANGQWVKKSGEEMVVDEDICWKDYGIEPFSFDWQLTKEDLAYSMPFGIQMVSNAITKPYSITRDVSDEMPADSDECFFMLLDRQGKWRINTLLKGFARHVGGFVSSFSTTGDIILIGKNKQDMLLAFDRMRGIQGGIVLVENGVIIHEIRLPLLGIMSNKDLPALMEEEAELIRLLVERGYPYSDPVYTLFFLSSTHLPYIRVTQRGMYDVKNKTVLFPTLMR
ncbi:adenine deaminase C-terminal domain-containing protein [Siminovitchia sp. FSL W7-1587]|uniref:adenine deaminase C-terminal domain-containing protein n=1 Tax=Siminovitchia sp. FSL W7-1587 TaxID=2954699 RepID=UPI0030CCD90C